MLLRPWLAAICIAVAGCGDPVERARLQVDPETLRYTALGELVGLRAELAKGDVGSPDRPEASAAHAWLGIPYAIAAQLAVGPERTVCLISGDSALGFNLMELETAVRHRLPILIVVNDDNHWGMEVLPQMMQMGQNVECATTPLRLDLIAQGFGAHGEYCEKTEEIRPAIERALASGQPAIVQIRIDPRVNANQMPEFGKFALWYAGNY